MKRIFGTTLSYGPAIDHPGETVKDSDEHGGER